MKYFTRISTVLLLATLCYAEPPVPSNQYLAPQEPSNEYLPPVQSYQAPSSSYLPPANGRRGNGGQKPSNQYLAPDVTSAIFSNGNTRNGGGFGNGAGNGHQEEDNFGPAKYEFKYDVQDEESGNNFGHMEARDGDLTTGRYYVLLPDGRTQVVEYEADVNGYRPTITYEGEAIANGVNGGFNNGAAGRGALSSGAGFDASGNGNGKFAGYQ